MSNQKCDGDCFNCKFDDCILDYDEVPLDENLDDYILDPDEVRKREKSRRKYRENRDHIRALWDKYYYSHKEKIKEYKHKYYLKHKDRIIKQQVNYQRKKRQMNAKPKKKKPKPKIVPKFQIAEYPIVPVIDPVETELNRRLKEAKEFIEHLSSLEVKWQNTNRDSKDK